MQQKIYIYGLCDPRTSELRYVGKTNSIRLRLASHKTQAVRQKRKHRSSAWIRSLHNIGLYPEIFIIEECCTNTWEAAERFWISYFRFIGANLTNHTPGGETASKTPETLAKFRATIAARTPEEKQRIANLAKTRFTGNKFCIGRKQTQRTIAKLAEANKGRPLSPEHRKRIGEAATLQKWLTSATPDDLITRGKSIMQTRRAHYTTAEWSQVIKEGKSKTKNPEFVDIMCQQCGKTFPVKFYSRNLKKTCSPACATALGHKNTDLSTRTRSQDGKLLPKPK